MIARRRPTIENRAERLLGPRDAGLQLDYAEFAECADAPGYVSELIDGAVYVSPVARPLHFSWQIAIFNHLTQYAVRNPERFNFVSMDCEIVVPERPGVTRPRPDIAAYRDFPARAQLSERNDWSFFSPVLAVEVVSGRRARKDTLRNRNLYRLTPAMREYWVVDPRKSPLAPRLIVHTRPDSHADWAEIEVAFGETWESEHFGDLSINLRALP